MESAHRFGAVKGIGGWKNRVVIHVIDPVNHIFLGLVFTTESGPQEGKDFLVLRRGQSHRLFHVGRCAVVRIDGSGHISESVLQPTIEHPLIPCLIKLALPK